MSEDYTDEMTDLYESIIELIDKGVQIKLSKKIMSKFVILENKMFKKGDL